MPIITIVTGGPESGKVLLGEALTQYIMSHDNKKAALLTARNARRLSPAMFHDYHDIILVSAGPEPELWMKEWFAAYGPPLFRITTERLKPE